MSTAQAFSLAQSATISTEWGTLTWLVNAELVEGAEVSFGLVTINPGHSNPPHRHPNCEETVYVLSGECEQQSGDTRVALKAGEGMVIPRMIEHCSYNTGDVPLVVIVCCSTGTRETTFRDAHQREY